MSRASSRNPSGSSTRSGAHSPSTSPINQSHPSQRIVSPTATGNMLSVGVGAASGLVGYNPGWQMWSSQRAPSITSTTSVGDLPFSSADGGYRGPLRSSSRPTSRGTWDDDGNRSQEFSHSHDAQPPPSLQSSRQRPVPTASLSAQRTRALKDDRPAKISPQLYERNLSSESTSPRYSSGPPTGLVSNSYSPAALPISQTPVLTGASGYVSLNQPPVDDLAMNFRGMAVEDDLSGRSKVNGSPLSIPMPSTAMQRPPLPMARPSFNSNFSTFSDYSYNAPPPMDPLSIYPSPAVNHALYPSVSSLPPPPVISDIRQPNLFFDFAYSRPPPTPFFYPSQGIIFPPTVSMSPMIPQVIPLSNKKRELSFNVNLNLQQHGQQPQSQHHFLTHLMFPPTTVSAPLPAYPNTIDFHQLPQLMPGGPLFAQNMAIAQAFPQTVPYRSPLLEEFRTNKMRNWELSEIAGYIVEFSGDQHGSRFIQQKLQSASSEERQKVYDEIVPRHTLKVMQDVFGNYVIQKLFEHGTQPQKSILASEMEGHILALSKQMYGCRVVQRAIECLLPEQQSKIILELEPYIMDCIYDANGNHASQDFLSQTHKLIERVSPERLGFVHTFRGNVQVLATHTFGCRVLQRAFEHLPEIMTAALAQELRANTLQLMANQFGNYVMQFIIEKGRPQDKAFVVSKLRGHLFQFARHKFASNVCEKALQYADAETRRTLIDEIISPKPERKVIPLMMQDSYANYVLQSAVKFADADQRIVLIDLIRPQIELLRRLPNSHSSRHLASSE
ncbi:hypothetical protein D9757_001870 [Collybiopsis confluens]|uniref:PUM-HD domain-containing protein n=1 Tax=Collybiopsis confluens TaxID=2823264 RepID=A0A8H5HY95_9AGAR|nr:hypothetical protein D9757_001870 [Collybiopsis confluens]